MMFNPKVIEITNLYADYNANKITLGELHDGIDAILRAERIDEVTRLSSMDGTTWTRVDGFSAVWIKKSEIENRLTTLKENK